MEDFMSRFKFKWKELDPTEAVKRNNLRDTRARLSAGIGQIRLNHFTPVDLPGLWWVLGQTEQQPRRDDLHRLVSRVNAFYRRRK